MTRFEAKIKLFDFDRELRRNLLAEEQEQAVDPHYLQTKQINITPTMRAMALDWMMEVSAEFGLKRETFALATSYVDCFLSRGDVIEKRELQLLGASSIFVAVKAEVQASKSKKY